MALLVNFPESLLFLAHVVLSAVESSVILTILLEHLACQVADVSLIINHLDLVVLIALVYVS
jgi:hypothetical protein